MFRTTFAIFLISSASAFFVQLPEMQRVSRPQMNNYGKDLDGELNKFFESASRGGASKFKKMSIEQRAEYAQRGEALENEIFELRDRMSAMEIAAIEGAPLDVKLLKELREELLGLKQDYIELVGAEDLPIYFGRKSSNVIYPDTLQ